MRIGIDACCWTNRRGFGRFTRELLTAMLALEDAHDYVFFVDAHTAGQCTFPARADVVIAEVGQAPVAAASAQSRRTLRDLWAMSRAVLSREIDLFFFPAVYTYFPVLNAGTRIVVTVHDLIADRFPALTFENRTRSLLWRWKEGVARGQADRLLTVSEHSRRRILERFRLPPGRVAVVTEAAAPRFRPLPDGPDRHAALRRHGLDPGRRFLLHVGGFSPHKNLLALLSVFARLAGRPTNADVDLALVGDLENDAFHTHVPALRCRVEELGIQPRVRFTGFVPDGDLVHLYGAAAAVVLPSFEEGFGLPAVEAMACGAAVAASRAGSLPEVVGDAGLFFDPHQPDEILRALTVVLGDEGVRNELRTRSLARARDYAWPTAARQALAVFAEVAQAGSDP